MIGNFKRPDAETAKINIAGADIMNAHLVMIEIMMSSVTNKYAHSALHELRERGMMRHNIKRRANTLDEITTEMMRRCNVHDKVQVETFTKTIFPSLTEDYIDNYGSLTLRLQNMFMKHFDNQLTLIKVATKNTLDKAMIKNSDIMTDIQMVAMMCSAGIYVYNAICNSVDHMLYGISKTTRAKSLHNEKMINAAKDLLREMGGNVAAPEKEGGDARKFAQDFMKELVKEDLMKMVESGIVAMQMDFIEFVIASLRIKIEEHSFTIEDYRMLLLRMGGKSNTRNLLKEIATIPLPENYDGDIIDLMETLPNSGTETAQDNSEENMLDKFRHLCLDDCIITNLESEEDTVMRRLRQEVYRNGGMLPEFILRYLYFSFGTKKAVTEYLTKADKDVMGKTLRMLKNLKANELRIDPGKEYGIYPGLAIKDLYELRGYTRNDFSAKTGVSKEYMKELENIGDISRNAQKILPVARLLKDVATILKFDVRHVLFASLRPTGRNGEVTKVYHYMMKMLEGKKEKSDEKEKGEKAEEKVKPKQN